MFLSCAQLGRNSGSVGVGLSRRTVGADLIRNFRQKSQKSHGFGMFQIGDTDHA